MLATRLKALNKNYSENLLITYFQQLFSCIKLRLPHPMVYITLFITEKHTKILCIMHTKSEQGEDGRNEIIMLMIENNKKK